MIKTIRPKLEFLSKELIQKIIAEAFDILEKQGVFVENKEALKLIKEAGMKVDESTQRVHITARLVEDSLSSTPPVIKFTIEQVKKSSLWVRIMSILILDQLRSQFSIIKHLRNEKR